MAYLPDNYPSITFGAFHSETIGNIRVSLEYNPVFGDYFQDRKHQPETLIFHPNAFEYLYVDSAGSQQTHVFPQLYMPYGVFEFLDDKATAHVPAAPITMDDILQLPLIDGMSIMKLHMSDNNLRTQKPSPGWANYELVYEVYENVSDIGVAAPLKIILFIGLHVRQIKPSDFSM